MPAADLEELIRLSRSRASSYRVVQRSRILVALARGASSREVSRTHGVSRATVARWRERYLQAGLAGVLRDRAGRGRPPRTPATVVERRAVVLAAEMQSRGEPVSLRRLARGLGVSYASLQRLNARHGWLRRGDAATVPRVD